MALILASTSPIRRQMLEAAGVRFQAVAPGVDEQAVKAEVRDARALPEKLAAAKALAVAAENPDAMVIGSDSVVTVDGRLFDKPANRDQAAEHLRFFSGKEMVLSSAVALAHGAKIEWSHSATARLLVRELSEEFIDVYLDAEWPEVSYCVGVFRLEGRGVQIFSEIEGDHFTILGMPLLPLLGALRERGLLQS